MARDSFPCPATTRDIRTSSRAQGLAVPHLRPAVVSAGDHSCRPWFLRRLCCPNRLEKCLFHRPICLDSPRPAFCLGVGRLRLSVRVLYHHRAPSELALDRRTDGRRDCILTWHNRGTFANTNKSCVSLRALRLP